MNKVIISDFKNKQGLYHDFEIKLKQLLVNLISSQNISYHQIKSRVKNEDSLRKKIQNKENKYDNLNEITDIVGIRIITHYEFEVDKIAELLSTEFKIDKINSVDKRNKNFDQFGYLSLHYVLELNTIRSSLLENESFKGIKAEIQIRSILQHAWAEIEHKLGYKGKNAIPNLAKRNFARIAALLETSDLEFNNLYEKLTNYEHEVPEVIKNNPEKALIDQTTLVYFVSNNKTIARIDQRISEKTSTPIINENEPEVSNRLKELVRLGIDTIEKLESILLKFESNISIFAEQFVNNYPRLLDHNSDEIELDDAFYSPGCTLFYLPYVIYLMDNNEKELAQFIDQFRSSGQKHTESILAQVLRWKETVTNQVGGSTPE